jgi:hypothetical protein
VSAALWAIKILRKLPHSARFDRYLDDCAAYEVAYRPCDPSLPPLRVAHVFRRAKLPILYPSQAEPMRHGIEVTGSADNVVRIRRREEPVIFDTI